MTWNSDSAGRVAVLNSRYLSRVVMDLRREAVAQLGQDGAKRRPGCRLALAIIRSSLHAI